jgi:trigger factor
MTIDPSKLQIAVEEQEAWRRRMTVTVPAGTVQTERGKVIQRVGARLKLPGFRKGKIPANVVEQRFGPSLDQEVLDKVIGEAYRQALKIEALEPISEGQVEDVSYQPREDLTFTISFDVQPVIELGRLGGFTVERPAVQVSDEDRDQVLARIREQNGAWKPVETGAPEEGNLVTVQITRLVNGEPDGEARPYEIVLGDGEAMPDVEEAIRTLSVGETGDFTVTFPEDFPDEERRGESQHLRILLEGRKEKELPELSDDFAQSLGDFGDLDALRARIQEDLEKEAQERAEGAVRARLMENLIEANPFQVPRSMAERYMDTILGDTSKLDQDQVAQTRESLRPEAEKAVKRILLVDRVAELQGLRASEEELDDRVEEIAERNDATPAQVYANLQKSGNLSSLESEITERKVYEFLKEQSTVTQGA